MIALKRKGLTLTSNKIIIPAQGSSEVPVKIENDEDEYKDYIIQPSVGYYKNNHVFHAELRTFSNNMFTIPASAFNQAGNVYISIGLVNPNNPSHIEKTLQATLFVQNAPIGKVILPKEETWQELVKNYMDELFDKVYKVEIDKIIKNVNDLIEEANSQQDKAKVLQEELNQAIENLNNKIENGDFIPIITAEATVDDKVGTPSVEIQKSGTAKNPILKFIFKNMKGRDGATSVVDNLEGNSIDKAPSQRAVKEHIEDLKSRSMYYEDEEVK